MFDSSILKELIKIAIIIVASFIIKSILNFTSDKFVEKTNNKRLVTIKQISHSVTSAIIFTIALIMILHQFGLDTTPLIAGASVIGASFGLGLQHTMKDLISGFFILYEDQFVVGDEINIQDLRGIVEKVSLRSTTIRAQNGDLHIIPNGEISKITILKK